MHTLHFVCKWNEPIPAFAFPAADGTHLLTPDGWKAE